MPKSSIARAVVIGLCTISSLATGQIAQGTVMPSNGVATVRTVVVTAVDSLGRERSRVLVDNLGRFRLALDAGTWRFRSRQIGYRMQESPSFVLRLGEERTLELSAPFREFSSGKSHRVFTAIDERVLAKRVL